jgi:hypothetical protein
MESFLLYGAHRLVADVECGLHMVNHTLCMVICQAPRRTCSPRCCSVAPGLTRDPQDMENGTGTSPEAGERASPCFPRHLPLRGERAKWGLREEWVETNARGDEQQCPVLSAGPRPQPG